MFPVVGKRAYPVLRSVVCVVVDHDNLDCDGVTAAVGTGIGTARDEIRKIAREKKMTLKKIMM